MPYLLVAASGCLVEISSSFSNHRGEENSSGCFTLIVFLTSCDCLRSVALSHGTLGWSAVCDCGISWLNSLTLYCPKVTQSLNLKHS